MKAQHVLSGAREYGTLAEAVADCGLVVGTTSIGHRALETRCGVSNTADG